MEMLLGLCLAVKELAFEMDFMELVRFLFDQGLFYSDILDMLREYGFDISLRHLHRLLRSMSLRRRTYSDIREVINYISHQLQESGQFHGYRSMHVRCRLGGLNVRVNDVRIILKELDPVGVEGRTARRFRRRSYFSPGPNFVWHVDGYDKLKPYGLCINGCICGFSRKIIWLNVYHTNSDPKVIGGYFLEAVKAIGGCPRVVRADLGTENGHIKIFQNFFWRNSGHDHRTYIDGASTTNQRIESWWGHLRSKHLQFWIELMKSIQTDGDFSADFLDKQLVLFCFASLLQNELDTAKIMWNSHTIRASRNDSVPTGQPNQMYNFPSLWECSDHLMPVSDADYNTCATEAEFRKTMPCDQDIFELSILIMQNTNRRVPDNVREATDLYLFLRREIRANL